MTHAVHLVLLNSLSQLKQQENSNMSSEENETHPESDTEEETLSEEEDQKTPKLKQRPRVPKKILRKKPKKYLQSSSGWCIF